ncbi:MAG TPA: type II toxin-antitoxin system PrlF family antitoxin [Coxiellaceae bacterium]|nr:MAG: hypothetical protein A3E81_03860 [Gammaproteobacteria bacterium RIFCSPHIGHO2_12_FULL_36_30]HLB56110.1 type II toxin-antitoxin system PrlF family antitoxin [Coxiellaceae bacterium]
MWRVKLTSKNQITVPKAIREYLKLKAGDQLQFIISKNGGVVVNANTLDIKDVVGMFNYKATKKKTSIRDMDLAIAKRMRTKYGKELKNSKLIK